MSRLSYLLVVTTFTLAVWLIATTDEQPPWSSVVADAAVPLESGWEYRWSEGPAAATSERPWSDPDPSPWQAIGYPSNPPGRDGREWVWYRVELPRATVRDPALYAYSIDLLAEFYLDGEPIYRFGPAQPERTHLAFAGWPRHLISLPEDYAGRTLYVRVWSDYPDIGLWGELALVSRSQLLERWTRESTATLVVGGTAAVLGLFALAFHAASRGRREYLYFGVLALCHAVMVLAQFDGKQLHLFAPLTMEYLSGIAYFGVPIALAGFIEQLVGAGPGRLLRGVRLLHLAGLAATLVLTVSGVIHFAAAYPPFDAVYAGTLPLMVLVALHAAWRGNVEARLLTGAFVVLAMFELYDTATARGLLPWDRQRVQWGVLLFLLTGAFILVRRFLAMNHRLAEVNQELERQVAARTSELRALNDELVKNSERLQALAITDPLTGTANRRRLVELAEDEVHRSARSGRAFSLLLLDLDHFKSINDRFGHQVGDVALCRVAELCRSRLRQGDLLARFGGEEFVILLPETSIAGATRLASELRSALAAWPMEVEGCSLIVTASIGVVEWREGESLDEMLRRADQALYAAKEAGRDRVVSS